MATVGLLSFSDGRSFAHEIVRDDIAAAEAQDPGRARGERARRRHGRRARVDERVRHSRGRGGWRRPELDCVIFNFAVWAFPHFTMLAAGQITCPLVLLSTARPGPAGLVGDARRGRRARPDRPRSTRACGATPTTRRCAAGLERRSRRRPAVRRLRGHDVRPHRRPPDGHEHRGRQHRPVAAPVRRRRRGDRPVEIVRRADAADAAEKAAAGEWLERALPRVHYDGEKLTQELLERQVGSYLAMRELIDELHLDFTGIKGQPELTQYFATMDVAEAFLNDPYDWNGPKEPHVCATEADMDGALTMQILKLLSRHPGAVRRRPPLPRRPRHLGPVQLRPARHLVRRAQSTTRRRTCAQVELYPGGFLLPGRRRVRAPRRRARRVDACPADPRRRHATGCTCSAARPRTTTRRERGRSPNSRRRTGRTCSPGSTRPPRCSCPASRANHIHAVPGDKRAELRAVCELLDIDCIELYAVACALPRHRHRHVRRRRPCSSTATGPIVASARAEHGFEQPLPAAPSRTPRRSGGRTSLAVVRELACAAPGRAGRRLRRRHRPLRADRRRRGPPLQPRDPVRDRLAGGRGDRRARRGARRRRDPARCGSPLVQPGGRPEAPLAGASTTGGCCTRRTAC